MALRRAHADEYAVRVNRAVALLGRRSPADAVRALQAEQGLSERQARRYVNAALERPEGVVVPERTGVFTVRLPPVVDRRLAPSRALARADAERGDGGGGALVSRSRSRAARWQSALRSSSSATGLPAQGWFRRTRSLCSSGAV
jgi:hypothetical protein